MTRILALSALFFSFAAAADYYGLGRVDIYDPITGLYYKAVVAERERSLMGSKGGPDIVNIAVVSPSSSGEVSLLFKEKLPGAVQAFIFEVGIKDGSMEFSGGEGTAYIKNNKGVSKREPKPRLLISVRDKENKNTILYVADKTGANLKQVAVVPNGDDWHLDVKNSKLRVVHQTGTTVKLDAYDW